VIVKFFPTGKGSARSAFSYLLNEDRVKAGTAKLIYGCPESITFLTEQRMKSSNYRGGALYTSGVLSFSADEKLTNSQLVKIARGFENTMFMNLDHSRFNRAWILHTDKERTELHFVIQNLDLETGKAYTPYVEKRDLARVNAFKNRINKVYKLADPNEKSENRHFFAKRHKNLTEEQRDFIAKLNQAYSHFKNTHDSTHQNEPYSNFFDKPDTKQAFLLDYLKSDFSHVKINRSSDSYISLDFGTGQKLRMFYEKQTVKEPDTDLKALKIEQNKNKGLLPVNNTPHHHRLMDIYIDQIKQYKEIQAKEELKRKAEQERKAEEERKQKEMEEKALLMIRQAEEFAALQRQQNAEKIAVYERQFLDQIGRSVTGSRIWAHEKPKYYNLALDTLDYIGKHFGEDVQRELFEKYKDKIERAYQHITGKSLNLGMKM
jgi:mobA